MYTYVYAYINTCSCNDVALAFDYALCGLCAKGAGEHSQFPLTCDESSCQNINDIFLRAPAPFNKTGPQYNVVVIGPWQHSVPAPTPF